MAFFNTLGPVYNSGPVVYSNAIPTAPPLPAAPARSYVGNNSFAYLSKYGMCDWLDQIGLGHLKDRFAAQRLDAWGLMEFDRYDYDDLKIDKLGHEKRLNAALQWEMRIKDAIEQRFHDLEDLAEERARFLISQGRPPHLAYHDAHAARRTLSGDSWARHQASQLKKSRKPLGVHAVAHWLRANGFGIWAPVFARFGIDGLTLLDLDEDELSEMGVVRLGDRRRLLQAISFENRQRELDIDFSIEVEKILEDRRRFVASWSGPSSEAQKQAFDAAANYSAPEEEEAEADADADAE